VPDPSANGVGETGIGADLGRGLAFERMILATWSRFAHVTDWDEAVNASLADMGSFCGADRAYLFLFRGDSEEVMDNTHEWCAPPVSPQRGNLQGIRPQDAPWWTSKLRAGQTIHIEDVSRLPPEAAAERRILQAQGIRSLVAFPVYAGQSMAGFIGLDNVSTPGRWSDVHTTILRVSAEMIGNALQHRRDQQALEKLRERLERQTADRLDALRLAEARLRHAADLLPMALAEFGLDLRFSYVNRAGLEMTGYSQRDIEAGLTVLDLVHPDDSQRAGQQIDKALRGEMIDVSEYRIVKRDGTEASILARSFPIRHEGKVVGLRSMVTEIRESRDLQQALQESEQRHRTLVETMNEGLSVMDDRGAITFVNPGLCNMLGCSEDELMGQSIFDLLDEENREILEAQEQKRRAGRNDSYELTFTTSAGRKVHTLVSPQGIFDDKGQYRGSLAALTDVTQRKQAEEALRKSEERLHSIIQSMPVMMDALDTNGNFLMWNRECERVTGYSEGEIVGNPSALELLYPDAACRARILREWKERGNDFRAWELDITCKDGSVRTIEWSNISGRFPVPGWFSWAVGVDITARRRAEEALLNAHRRLMRAREEECRRLAKELHDSVGQRLVALQLALQDGQGNGGGQADPSEVCRELIREVRAIGHGLYPATLESLGLVSALKQLVSHYRGSSMRIAVQALPELESLRLSNETEIALFRIAQEAVSNAVRHSGGSRIAIRLKRGKDRLALSIKDNGAGFEPRQVCGKGIGLSTMRERAQAANGEMTIVSGSKGTKVAVTVPI
jgi:PAS domain S-box-containing protein